LLKLGSYEGRKTEFHPDTSRMSDAVEPPEAANFQVTLRPFYLAWDGSSVLMLVGNAWFEASGDGRSFIGRFSCAIKDGWSFICHFSYFIRDGRSFIYAFCYSVEDGQSFICRVLNLVGGQ
jgi:hypothetical protein